MDFLEIRIVQLPSIDGIASKMIHYILRVCIAALWNSIVNRYVCCANFRKIANQFCAAVATEFDDINKLTEIISLTANISIAIGKLMDQFEPTTAEQSNVERERDVTRYNYDKSLEGKKTTIAVARATGILSESIQRIGKDRLIVTKIQRLALTMT